MTSLAAAACRSAPLQRGARQPTVRCSAAPTAAVGAQDRARVGKSGEPGGAVAASLVYWRRRRRSRCRPPCPAQASLATSALPPISGLEVSSLGIGAWSWGDRSRYWQNDLDKDSNLTVSLCRMCGACTAHAAAGLGGCRLGRPGRMPQLAIALGAAHSSWLSCRLVHLSGHSPWPAALGPAGLQRPAGCRHRFHRYCRGKFEFSCRGTAAGAVACCGARSTLGAPPGWRRATGPAPRNQLCRCMDLDIAKSIWETLCGRRAARNVWPSVPSLPRCPGERHCPSDGAQGAATASHCLPSVVRHAAGVAAAA